METKFRGKRLNTGEWVCGDLWQPVRGGHRITFILRQDNKYEVRPETVSQCIGIKGKNDCDMFGGDWFQHTAGNGSNVLTGLIIWHVDQWRVSYFTCECCGSHTCKKARAPYRMNYKDWANGLVVGNIIDNPIFCKGT